MITEYFQFCLILIIKSKPLALDQGTRQMSIFKEKWYVFLEVIAVS
jgi:hypothetical protein